MSDDPIIVKQPLVMIFQEPDGEIITHIWPNENANSHEAYGLIIYDLVRHVANAFKVSEDDVWEWVKKERHKHTTEIKRPT